MQTCLPNLMSKTPIKQQLFSAIFDSVVSQSNAAFNLTLFELLTFDFEAQDTLCFAKFEHSDIHLAKS